jgi:hypothetical protein
MKCSIIVQNVVTYDVVIKMENPNFRSNRDDTSLNNPVNKKDVLGIPNAALRFTPADKERQGATKGQSLGNKNKKPERVPVSPHQ